MINIMASIRAPWCRLIFDGRKPIELRKSAPHLPDGETAFRVMIYETRWKKGRGAVVGEAICFAVEKVKPPFGVRMSEMSCVDPVSIRSYARGGPIYGWYLGNVIEYRQPHLLSQYGLQRAPQSWCYVKSEVLT